ncbi:MAG: response regulator transcription factor [Bacteroidetes bacterium]|mgnify:CR=1 FL=1|jgi:two-component system, LytTR family, response regulator|nr:response regulator transcription factor [Bacteroidota bacterium]MBT6685407.1 response regulator transcription factor [Bacteroidota bacterium]MBT7143760.1 response regulator transcription factor [Bacteroidota bacterium]
MKVLIIEDEKPAAEKLEMLLQKYNPDIEVLAKISTVQKTIEWFKNSKIKPELLFLDIHLADGLCFEIFRKININTPAIFVTAYNEYAIEAFKLNSIDYLLKPITYESLYSSLEKLKSMRENLTPVKQRLQFEELGLALSQFQKNFKNRFLIKIGEHIRSVKVEDISMFHAEGRIVYLITKGKKRYIVDYILEDLEEILDPAMFFRVNRSFVININSISDVLVFSKSRLKIKLLQEFEKEIIVSRDKVSNLKIWLDGME